MGYSDFDRPDADSHEERTGVGPIRTIMPITRIVRMDDESKPPVEEQGGVEVWALFRTLLRRKFLILSVVVLGVAIAAVLTLRVTPVYAAVTTVEVQAREMQIIQGASVDPASVGDADFIGTQIALLKSRALAERVAENLNLVDEPAYANQGARPDVRLNQAASRILAGLSISPVRGARVIEVRYQSTAKVETARIANAVAENFIELTLDRRYSATSYARKFLEERLAATKTTLEQSERRLVEYSAEKEILDLTSVGGSEIGSSLDASALVSLSATLTEAQNDRIMAEQKYREAADNPSSREMLESEAIQKLRETRSQLSTEYQTKLATLRPEHPEMVDIQARLKGVDDAIESERTNIVKALQAAYKASIAREEALAKRVEELKSDVQGLRVRSIDYNILHREVDTLRTQYDALLQRLKEVGIASAVGTSQVSVLDRALVPAMPFSPDLTGSLLRALALSFALAIPLALFVEFLDDRIRTPEDITGKLGIRVIGVIPKTKSKESIVQLLRNPRSVVAEAFSSARAALQFAIIAGSLKSILITGSRPSEGKTTATLALATAFAAVGKKVLIIDADLRRPSFAFDANASAGLSGVLSDGLPLADHIVPGPSPNLDLLPAGPVPGNPTELLAGSRLVHVMAEATQHYDLVFIDSPPVLTFADAPILASVCDGVLLVVQSGGVFRQAARRSVERLRGAHANITGAVLTKFDPRRAGYGAAHGYGPGYGEAGYRKLASASEATRRVRYFSDTDSTKF